jgi:hypothetical protein
MAMRRSLLWPRSTETGAGIDSFPTTSRRNEHGSTPLNCTCPAMTTTPSFYQHPVAYGTSAPIEHPKPALGTLYLTRAHYSFPAPQLICSMPPFVGCHFL